tara:strand:+ start:126 stop:737 length:612 start_codon:yes stop_codon:yes gene_type:complete
MTFDIGIVKSLLNLGNKYGYFNLTKIIIFEILNFNFKKIYEYKFDKPLRKNSEYYFPSFYYALWIVKKKIDLSQKNFIDFGSGKGRTLNYLLKSSKDVLGIEYNFEYKKNIPENLKDKIIWGDCYDNNLIKDIIIKFNSEPILLYFYHPFEEKRVNEIISEFTNTFNDLHIVMIGNIQLNNKNKLYFESFYENKLLRIFKKKL